MTIQEAVAALKINPVFNASGVALFNADCRKHLPVIPSDGSVVISDPPYGIKWSDPKTGRRIKGDDKPFDPSHLLRFKCVLFGGQHFHTSLPQRGSWIIWDKRCNHKGGCKWCNMGPVHAMDIGDYEDIWCSFHTHRTIYRQYWSGSNVAVSSERKVGNFKRIHITQKPVELMRWLISEYTSPGDLIIDPYAGSCSTLIAAHQLGRQAIGFELDPIYIGPAVERLQSLL